MTILSNIEYNLQAGVVTRLSLPPIGARHASVSWFVYSATGDLEFLEDATAVPLLVEARASLWKVGPFRLNAGAPLFVRSATTQTVRIIGIRDESSTAVVVGPSGGPVANFEFLDDQASETPFTLSARTKLTIDGLGSTTERRFGSGYFDVSSNLIVAEEVGTAYDLRLNLMADRLTSGNDELRVEVQIEAPSPFVVASDLKVASVGGFQPYSFILPLFALEAFVQYGAGLYLTPQGGNFDISDINLYLRKAA